MGLEEVVHSMRAEPAAEVTRPRVTRRRVTVAQAMHVLATLPQDAIVTSFTVDLLELREEPDAT
jgi:hypothetical protein